MIDFENHLLYLGSGIYFAVTSLPRERERERERECKCVR